MTILGQCVVTNGSTRVVAGADKGSPLTSGILAPGLTYRIVTFVAGDNFSNLGATNVTGNIFRCTGSTGIPTSWTHGSTLQEIQNTLADWSTVVFSKDVFYVPAKRNVAGYENGQGYFVAAFTDGSSSGSGFDELTLMVAFTKPTGSVYFEIHTDFTTAGFVILKYGDTETADAVNRNTLLAENLLTGATPIPVGGIRSQPKTISGGEAGLDVIAVSFTTAMPTVGVPPLWIGIPACIKAADGDSNNPCVGLSSVTDVGFKIHLQSGAIPGQKYDTPYIPST